MKAIGIAIMMFSLNLMVGGHQPARVIEASSHSTFKGERAIKTYKQTINASPDKIFPLICPIREAEWADGWVGKAVYAPSGYAEQDGVYATEHGEKDDTIWVITRRDTSKHEIEFVYFVPGIRVTRLTISVQSISHLKSNVYIRYITTGLSEKGNQEILKTFTDASFNERMAEWERAMNYFLETGKLLKDQH